MFLTVFISNILSVIRVLQAFYIMGQEYAHGNLCISCLGNSRIVNVLYGSHLQYIERKSSTNLHYEKGTRP